MDARCGLSESDLGLLLEAVELWEHGDEGMRLVGDMLKMSIRGEPEEAAMRRLEAERAKRDVARRTRKERGVLLRAKLIMLRDARAVDELLESRVTGGGDHGMR